MRLKIAEKIRAKSKQDKQYKSLDIMDVNLAFTAQTMKEFGVNRLIHGGLFVIPIAIAPK